MGLQRVLTLGDISDLIKSDFLLVILEVDEIYGILQVKIRLSVILESGGLGLNNT